MSLFEKGEFTSHSGLKLNWKIECDALVGEDWEALAHAVAKSIPFGRVDSVPKGGDLFAAALAIYANPNEQTLLLVDDVLTTGRSMEKVRDNLLMLRRPIIGVVAFSRAKVVPAWIRPVFQLNPMFNI